MTLTKLREESSRAGPWWSRRNALSILGESTEHFTRKLAPKYSGHNVSVSVGSTFLRPGSNTSAVIRAKGPSLLGRHTSPPVKKENSE